MKNILSLARSFHSLDHRSSLLTYIPSQIKSNRYLGRIVVELVDGPATVWLSGASFSVSVSSSPPLATPGGFSPWRDFASCSWPEEINYILSRCNSIALLTTCIIIFLVAHWIVCSRSTVPYRSSSLRLGCSTRSPRPPWPPSATFFEAARVDPRVKLSRYSISWQAVAQEILIIKYSNIHIHT